jgi:hypothetical protein
MSLIRQNNFVNEPPWNIGGSEEIVYTDETSVRARKFFRENKRSANRKALGILYVRAP